MDGRTDALDRDEHPDVRRAGWYYICGNLPDVSVTSKITGPFLTQGMSGRGKSTLIFSAIRAFAKSNSFRIAATAGFGRKSIISLVLKNLTQDNILLINFPEYPDARKPVADIHLPKFAAAHGAIYRDFWEISEIRDRAQRVKKFAFSITDRIFTDSKKCWSLERRSPDDIVRDFVRKLAARWRRVDPSRFARLLALLLRSDRWWTVARSTNLPGQVVMASGRTTRGPDVLRMTQLSAVRGEPFTSM
jgi:hypothetical protein